MRGTVDNYILTDDIVIAHDKLALLAYEVEILRKGSKYRTLMNLVSVSHPCTVQDAHEREDNAIVAYDNIILYIYKREYLTAVSNLCLWGHLGFWTDYATHNLEI